MCAPVRRSRSTSSTSRRALTTIVNLDDGSYSLIGELLYTGFGDFEMRLRAAVNVGERLTDFGEKPVDERLELRLRWHF